MINRKFLEQAYPQVRQTCLGLLISPALLTLVAWNTSSASGTPGAPGSGDIALPLLVGLGVLALSPLALVSPALWGLRKVHGRPDHVDAAQRMQALIPREGVVTCGLWQLPVLAGFVGFFAGAAWWFFLCALVLTYVGSGISFPRLSRWYRRADELDAQSEGRSLLISG